MKVSLLTLAALYALAAAPRVRADEPAKTRVVLQDRWKAGLTVTRTVHEVEKVKGEVKVGDQVLKDQSKDFTATIDATYVYRCDEADAEGRSRKAVVHVTSWSKTVGTEKDESLQGVTVDVVGGAKPSYAARDGERKPSDDARAWLDKTFGEKSPPDVFLGLEPAEPLAVGGTWKPDLEKFLTAIGNPFELDREKSTVVGTLEKVEGDLATSTMKIDLVTKFLPSPVGPLPWKEGGTYSFLLRVVHRTDGSPLDASVALQHGIKGVTTGGATVTIDQMDDSTETAKAGGTVPEPKAGTPPPPPVAPTK